MIFFRSIFCILLLPGFLFGQGRAQKIDTLSQDPQWLALLHVESGIFGTKSTIDSKEFFLSEKGKWEASEELSSTLHALSSPKALRDQQSTRCLYPARALWLAKKFPEFAPSWPALSTCTRYLEWKDALNVAGLTMIYPAAFMNNPASMFGHTLLRLDEKGQTKDSEMLSYSVNYGASTGGENAILYAAYGLLGFYPGYFAIEPYYKMLSKYSDKENRDIWEYPLHLTDEELEIFLAHLWELRGIALQYYYFDENCSYHLLSALQVARPSLSLTRRFPLYAIPLDTLKAVLQSPGIAGQGSFRPSAATLLRARLAQASKQEVQAALHISESGKLDFPENDMTAASKAHSLDLAYDMLEFKRQSSKEYSQEQKGLQFSLLKERSELGLPSQDIHIPPPAPPENSHGTFRARVQSYLEDDDAFVAINLRPAYHDILDRQAGYVPGAGISFLDGQIALGDDDHLRLDYLRLLEILSISPRDEFFRSSSWHFESGLRRAFVDSPDDNSLVYENTLGLGRGVFLGQDILMAGFLDLNIDISRHFGSDMSFGGGSSAIFAKYFSDEAAALLRGKANWGMLGEKTPEQELRAEFRWTLGKDRAIRLGYARIFDMARAYHKPELSFDLYW